MKRKLLVLALGIGFLIVVSWAGGVLTDLVPRTPSAHIQSARVGSYQVTLQVDPNPPPLTRPASVSIQLANADRQAITGAYVSIDLTMETMDMGTLHTEAHAQGPGVYLASVQFAMSGPWQLQVEIVQPGQKSASTAFTVIAQ